ncbi:MAG: GerAB/ArcD/ProY family transporter [Clostridiales bacterium]|nr:GerAB/ArcD/ProY family transporter [Clostridiales bacterium]
MKRETTGAAQEGAVKNHIGVLGASALIFCSRIFYLLTYSPQGEEYGGSVSMLAFFLAGVASMLLCSLFYHILRRCGARSLPELYHRQGRVFAVLCELAVLGILFGSALSTVMNFSSFMSTAVYPGSGAQVTAAAVVLAAAYGAYSGIEAISRLAIPVTAVLLLGLLTAAAGIAGTADFVYLTAPRPEAVPQVLELFFQALFHNTEVLLFLVLSDKIRDCTPRVYLSGTALSMSVYQAAILLVTITLGPFTYVRSYPIYSMLAAAELSVLNRLDIVNLVVWIFITFVRCSAYLYCICGCIRRLAPDCGREKVTLGVGLFSTLAAVYLCGGLDRGLMLWELWSGAAPFLLFTAVLLLAAVSALIRVKQTQRREKR